MIERGAEIRPNSVVPPGRLIPAGQLWGGSPVRYIRDLTEDEKWANYNDSYNQTVQISKDDKDSRWPKAYLEEIPEGEEGDETISEYVEKNYMLL